MEFTRVRSLITCPTVYSTFFLSAPIRNLLKLLTWSVTELFTVRTVTSAVRCWQWLLAAEPGIHLNFINEMVAAWNQSHELRIGNVLMVTGSA